MVSWKALKRLSLISIICIIGNASCNSQPIYKEQSLPELPYAQELQEAIDQVLITHSDYDLGISAAVLVPGHKTWTGVSGYSQSFSDRNLASLMLVAKQADEWIAEQKASAETVTINATT